LWGGVTPLLLSPPPCQKTNPDGVILGGKALAAQFVLDVGRV